MLFIVSTVSCVQKQKGAAGGMQAVSDSPHCVLHAKAARGIS